MRINRLNKMNDILKEMVEEPFVTGANCMVLKEGKEIAYYQCGYADFDRNKKIKRDSIFRLYSMTKPVTAAAVMILFEEGKIDLLDPISKYISEFENMKVENGDCIEEAKKQITIHDLLSMTSGLVYEGEESKAQRETDKVFKEIVRKLKTDNEITTLDVSKMLSKCPLAYQPGEKWQYGTSADVLGALVEVVSGIRFGKFLNERIFEPLNMKDTGFYVPENKQDRLVDVCAPDCEGDSIIKYTKNHLGIINDMKTQPNFESGGAGLVSTIEDYAKFATMLLNNGTLDGIEILTKETVKFMTNSRLSACQQDYFDMWEGLQGHSYGNLMRVMIDSKQAILNGYNGEYGWDGWLGAYFHNDPKNNITFLFMMQRVDSGTTSYTRKLRNVMYSAL